MKERSYEQAMQRLEAITASLEDGSLSLEQSLKLYEEAASLVRFCSACLDNAEQKIMTLTDVEAQQDA